MWFKLRLVSEPLFILKISLRSRHFLPKRPEGAHFISCHLYIVRYQIKAKINTLKRPENKYTRSPRSQQDNLVTQDKGLTQTNPLKQLEIFFKVSASNPGGIVEERVCLTCVAVHSSGNSDNSLQSCITATLD